MRPCCPSLNITQEKAAKAEEEVDLLEEQSQHYKDELDKALRQIENLNANSQSVGHVHLTIFFLNRLLLQGASRTRSRVQSDRGSDKVKARNSAHSELSPSLADSDPPGGKTAPAKEPGTHTHFHSSLTNTD